MDEAVVGNLTEDYKVDRIGMVTEFFRLSFWFTLGITSTGVLGLFISLTFNWVRI